MYKYTRQFLRVYSLNSCSFLSNICKIFSQERNRSLKKPRNLLRGFRYFFSRCSAVLPPAGCQSMLVLSFWTHYTRRASNPATERSGFAFFSHNVRVPHQRILVIGLAARIGFFLQCRRKRPEVGPVEYRAQAVGYTLSMPAEIRA